MNKKKEKNTPGYFSRKKAEWEGMRLWNGEELCRLDWIFSFLILAVLFVLCAGAMLTKAVSPVGILLPQFYPRIILYVIQIRERRDK